MAATRTEIDTYLSNIDTDIDAYKTATTKDINRGEVDEIVFKRETNGDLLDALREILVIHFGDGTAYNGYPNAPMLTVSQAEQAMIHINNILETTYWLELE